MEIVIRKAEPKDVPAIMGLVRELALFEKAPEEVVNTEEKMLKDGFGDILRFKHLLLKTALLQPLWVFACITQPTLLGKGNTIS
jgi:hypothetical protein